MGKRSEINHVFPLIKFNFYETNFKKEKLKFDNYISNFNSHNVSSAIFANFPPCVTMNGGSQNHKMFILSKSRVLLSNNLCFGEQYKDLNVLFQKSQFISITCKQCVHFKKNVCRGLLNNKYLTKKEEIIKKIGFTKYNAIKSDYENGLFVFGSVCKNSCKFCVDKFTPNKFIKKIPFLSVSEIIHFLHYLPKRIDWIGTSYHCASGEFFDHPKFFEIMNFLPKFMSNKAFIFTNGIHFNKKQIKLIKQKKVELVLSVHTLNDRIRRNIMGYKHSVNIKKQIKLLDIVGVSYSCCFVPLNFLINSKDTEASLNYLVKFTNTSRVGFSRSMPTKYSLKSFKNELLVDEAVISKLMRYNDKISPASHLSMKPEPIRLPAIINKLTILSKTKRLLVLSPLISFKKLKTRFKYNSRIHVRLVPSFLGEHINIAGVLTVKDYISVIKSFNFEYDYVILPKNSFDSNLDDFTLVNINHLYDFVKKPIILI